MTRDADSTRFPFLVNVDEARILSHMIAADSLAGEEEGRPTDWLQIICCIVIGLCWGAAIAKIFLIP